MAMGMRAPQKANGTLIQDNQGITPALELGRQHQEDDDDGEEEGHIRGVAFLDELAGIRRIVHEEPGREIFLACCIHEIHYLAHGPLPKPLMVAELSCWNWLSWSGTTLLLMVAMVDRGTMLPLGGPYVVLLQLITAAAELVGHLRDDLVAAALQVEEVQIAAAQHHAERIGRHPAC